MVVGRQLRARSNPAPLDGRVLLPSHQSTLCAVLWEMGCFAHAPVHDLPERSLSDLGGTVYDRTRFARVPANARRLRLLSQMRLS